MQIGDQSILSAEQPATLGGLCFNGVPFELTPYAIRYDDSSARHAMQISSLITRLLDVRFYHEPLWKPAGGTTGRLLLTGRQSSIALRRPSRIVTEDSTVCSRAAKDGMNRERKNFCWKHLSVQACLALLFGSVAMGFPGQVKLKPTPQRFPALYSNVDSRIPADVRARLAHPRQTAQAGRAIWRVEADSIIRDPNLRLSFDSGLPVGGLRAIAIATDGAVWAGGSEGLVRYQKLPHPWDRWQYFGGRRYLPSDDVTALAAGEGGSMWVSTSAGVSHIEFRMMTLAEKAALFEERIAQRHKRHGLIGGSGFGEQGNASTSHQYPSDNDGLWTSIYVGAQAFRFSVTRDSKARDSALQSVEAMLKLVEITGRSGLPARSFRHKSEPRHLDGVWHFTSDGEWEWKGDTSSDEIVGHFFAYSVVYDLVADEPLKKRLRKAVAEMADHLIEHNYQLTDIHGGPTRWGRYDPAYFETDDGREERALRSLELLSHLKVTHHMTGEPRFDREYRKLIDELAYHINTTTYLQHRQELNYSDEELAMLSYYPLFVYEKDPALLHVYRAGLEQWWVNEQREANPLWTFIYAVCNPGRPAPLEDATRTLYRIPIDLIDWSTRNSHRRDVPPDESQERFGRPQTTRLLPPDERSIMKWNSNPFRLDGGGGGRGEDDGSFFLLPYWMGRHHRLLLGE
jgi:hypothetical protein